MNWACIFSAGYYVAPISYRSEGEYRRDRDEFLQICRRGQLQCSITGDWTLETPVGQALAEDEPEVARRILAARDHLRRRLDECDGPGHEAGLGRYPAFAGVTRVHPSTAPENPDRTYAVGYKIPLPLRGRVRGGGELSTA